MKRTICNFLLRNFITLLLVVSCGSLAGQNHAEDKSTTGNIAPLPSINSSPGIFPAIQNIVFKSDNQVTKNLIGEKRNEITFELRNAQLQVKRKRAKALLEIRQEKTQEWVRLPLRRNKLKYRARVPDYIKDGSYELRISWKKKDNLTTAEHIAQAFQKCSGTLLPASIFELFEKLDVGSNSSLGKMLLLSGSEPGIPYQLLKEGEHYGEVVFGTGHPLEWTCNLPGHYSVVAIGKKGHFPMDGVVVIEDDSPIHSNEDKENDKNGFVVHRGERPFIDLSKVSPDDVEPGIVLIKFKPEYDEWLANQPPVIGPDGFVRFNMDPIDQLMRQHGAKNFRIRFSTGAFANGFTDKHKAWGFHRWFQLGFDDHVDVVQAALAFRMAGQLEIAEPEFRKKHLGSQKIPATIYAETSTMSTPTTWRPNDPSYRDQWHYKNNGQSGGERGADISLEAAWGIERGNSKVIVAIIDDGVQYNHMDLAGNMWPGIGYNFVTDTSKVHPGDHGTHVAGTVSAVSNNSFGVAGIAGGSGNNDGVRLMSCQVFMDSGMQDLLYGGFDNALIWAADNGAAISQNSWIYTRPLSYNHAVLDAIDYFNINGGGEAIIGGGVSIFAAGNFNSTAPYYPAYYSGAISVAATNQEDKKAQYSNYGPWINISAPGGETSMRSNRGILSTTIGGRYEFFQGTSMACPHVSGVAALVVSHAYGKLSPQEVKDILLNSTDDIDENNPDYAGMLGTGRLNAFKALQETANNLYGIANIAGFRVRDFSQNSISLAWDNNRNSDPVLLVWGNSPVMGKPVNGIVYQVGDILPGGGTVLFSGKASDFEHKNLVKASTYHYKIWAFDQQHNHSSGLTQKGQTSTCSIEDQCTYTFRLTSLANGSWGNGYINVEQGGRLVATLYKYCGTPFFDVEVPFCPDENFKLIISPNTSGELIGVEAIGPFGNLIFNFLPGETMPGNRILYSGMADCNEPNCHIATDLSAKASGVDALLGWTANNEETEWNIEWGPRGFKAGTGTLISGIKQKPFLLTGLQPGTAYGYMVQAQCNLQDVSHWSHPLVFETECHAFDVPFSENFDHVKYRELPLCWNKLSNASTDIGSAVWGHDQVTFFHDTNVYSMLATPEINADLSLLRVRFKLRWYHHPSTMYIGTISDVGDGTTFSPISEFHVFAYTDTGEEWFDQVVYFDQYKGNDRHIAFKFGSEDAANPAWAWVDDIVVEYIPEVPAPHGLQSKNIIETGFELDWEQTGTHYSWSIQYGHIGFDPDTEGVSIANLQQKPYKLTGLQSGQHYQVYIKANNGSSSSDWSIPINVTTDIFPLPIPYYEDFNNATVPLLTPGWKSIGEQMFISNTFYGFGVNNSIGMRLHHGYWNSTSILTAPRFTIPISDISVSFFARHFSNVNLILEVGVLTDLNDINSFQAIDKLTIPHGVDFNGYKVYFSGYEGIDGLIAFKIAGTQDEYKSVMLDNMLFEAIPSCGVPVQLSASLKDDNSIVLNWKPTGKARKWDISICIPGFDADMGQIIESVDQDSYTTSVLPYSSSFQFYVRSNCEGQVSEWSESYTFSTSCQAFDIPYHENFDSYKAPWLPACWHANGSGQFSVKAYNWDAVSSPNQLNMKASPLGESWVALPNFNEPADQLKLSFDAKCFEGGETLLVGLMSDVDDLSSFRLVQTFTLGKWPAYDYKRYAVFFEGHAQAGDRMVLRYSNYGSIYIDDVSVEEVGSCPEPSNLMASQLGTTWAMLGWEQAGNHQAEWQLVYGHHGFNPDTDGTKISSIIQASVLISNLIEDTNYDFYVRSHCGASYSAWSLAGSFQTECGIKSIPYHEDFNNVPLNMLPTCWQFLSEGNVSLRSEKGIVDILTPENSWVLVVAPELEFPASAVSMRLAASYNFHNPYVEVGVVDETFNPQSFRTIQKIAFAEKDVFEDFQIFFKYPNAQNERIAIRYGDYSVVGFLRIKEVSFQSAPQYPEPHLLKLENITGSSAILNWTDIGNPDSWEIKIGKQGFDPNADGKVIHSSTQNIELLGLEPGTFYDIYVCGRYGAETSNWSIKKTFQSECGPKNIPYRERFDNAPLHSLPACWSMLSLGGANCFLVDHHLTYPNKSLETTIHFGNQVILVAPEINGPLGSIVVSFNLLIEMGELEIEAGTMSNLNDMASFVPVKRINATLPNTSFQHFAASFDAVQNNNGRIAFRLINKPQYTRVYFSEFLFEKISACPEPIALQIEGIGIDHAQVLWDCPGNGQLWELAYGPNGFDPDAAGTSVQNISQKSYSLQNLPSATTFEVRVRSICGLLYSEWSVPVQFTTSCGSYSLPYREDFDKQPAERLPYCFLANGTGQSLIRTSSYLANSLPHGLHFYVDRGDAWFALPELSTDERQLMLKFDFYGDLNRFPLKIGLMEDIANLSSFEVAHILDTNQDRFSFVPIEVAIKWDPNKKQRIAFLVEQTGSPMEHFLDNIRVEAIAYNEPPIAHAGADQVVNEGDTVVLDGSGSFDPENNNIVYSWIVPTGIELIDATSAKPSFIAPEVQADSTLHLELIVNDGFSDSKRDTVTITVKNINKAPVALPGMEQTVSEGDLVQLDASASYDPDGDPITFSWSAPKEVELSSSTSANPTFIAPGVDSLTEFRITLIVNDGHLFSLPAELSILVKNRVNADQMEHIPFIVRLFPNPTDRIANLEWSYNGNDGVEITVSNMLGQMLYQEIANETKRIVLDLTALPEGLYILRLKAGNEQAVKKVIIKR